MVALTTFVVKKDPRLFLPKSNRPMSTPRGLACPGSALTHSHINFEKIFASPRRTRNYTLRVTAPSRQHEHASNRSLPKQFGVVQQRKRSVASLRRRRHPA